MDIYNEIKECLDILKSVYIESPKFNYYNNRMQKLLLKAYEIPSADKKVLSAYDNKRIALNSGNLDFDIYRIFTQYNRMKTVGNTMVTDKNLPDILRLRQCCCELDKLNNVKVIELLSSSDFIYTVISENLVTIRTLMDSKIEDYKFFYTMNNTLKDLFSLLNVTEYNDKYKEIVNKFFDLKLEYLNSNKEFYRVNDNSDIKKSNSFSAVFGEDGEDYVEYYKDYYVIKVTRAFLSNLMDFDEDKKNIYDEIDSLNLSGKSKDYIKISCNSCVITREPNYPMIIYSYHRNKELKDLCYLSKGQLYELNRICVDVRKTFSKDSLIKESYMYAKFNSMSNEGQMHGAKVAYVNTLEYMLAMLVDFDLITPVEASEHVEKVKKIYREV